jgi:hypothetical protein
MSTLIIYGIYLIFSFVLTYLFHIDFFPPLPEKIMATIMLWTFIWAASVSQVVGIGKLFRRQKKNE